MSNVTLESLHELPWSEVEGAYVRVLVTTEEREGEIVGRAEGTGLYYDSDRAKTVTNSIGPCIYLETPEDTILEVRTEKIDNELVEFEQ